MTGFRLSLILIAPFVLNFSLTAHSSTCPGKPNSMGVMWSGAEHMDLADRGFFSACDDVGEGIPYCDYGVIPRKDRRVSLTYGQLNALGDFYLEELQAFEEQGRTEISESGLNRIFKCIDQQGQVHEEQRERPEVDYPSCTWVFFFNTKNMIQTVTSNISHFAWHNMKTYVRVHGAALKEASKARFFFLNGQSNKADYYWRKALYLNGFADHFLTDAFPAGHIRVPRKELKSWAKENLGGYWGQMRGDLLSMVLHDSEAKDKSGREVGLMVKNSLGDQWRTRSDGKLNECREEDHIGVALPSQAVYWSVLELLTVYSSGQFPEGTYRATELVPFPMDSGLASKVKSHVGVEGLDGFAERLHSYVPVALKWFLTSKHIKKMIRQLDKIMSQFRGAVEGDMVMEKEYEKRLPWKYLEAFKNIK